MIGFMSIVEKKQAIISCLITDISNATPICRLNLLLFQFNDKLRRCVTRESSDAIIRNVQLTSHGASWRISMQLPRSIGFRDGWESGGMKYEVVELIAVNDCDCR
jgi:hypothetical protein